MAVGKETTVQDLIEAIDEMLVTIEENESFDEDFTIVREVAAQLREEIVALQE